MFFNVESLHVKLTEAQQMEYVSLLEFIDVLCSGPGRTLNVTCAEPLSVTKKTGTGPLSEHMTKNSFFMIR